MKNNFIWIIGTLILFLSCQSKNSINQIYLHLEFKKVDTLNIAKSFGNDFVSKLSQFSKSELSDVYIVEVQNMGLDSIFIPVNYSGKFPVYYSGRIKYFNSTTDTTPYKVNLPFNIPTNVCRLARNEKKCFLTSISIGDNIAKVDYNYYLTPEKKDLFAVEVALKKQDNELIDVTKN